MLVMRMWRVKEKNTYSQMCIDARVTCCTREILVLAVGDVLVCLRVSVLLGKSEIDYIYLCTLNECE